MKAAERLARQLAANIDESMGATGSGGAAGMFPGAVHGGPGAFPSSAVHGGPGKYDGSSRIKDALAIEVDRIVPDPDQPRKEFEEEALASLAGSLKERGQIQPIRVRWGEQEGRWIIVSGERRWRAARMAGLPTLACIEVKREMSPAELLEDQLVENAVREDLKPIEQAMAFRALLDLRGCSARQLADSLRISHQAVGRALSLLSLPEDVRQQVDAGVVPASAAAEVAKIKDDDARREIVGKISRGELTRDETVEMVRRETATKGRGSRSKPKAKRTTASFRLANGYKLTLENRRGVDDTGMRAALAEALAQIDDRLNTDVEAA